MSRDTLTNLEYVDKGLGDATSYHTPSLHAGNIPLGCGKHFKQMRNQESRSLLDPQHLDSSELRALLP